jgi:hypothetical protein
MRQGFKENVIIVSSQNANINAGLQCRFKKHIFLGKTEKCDIGREFCKNYLQHGTFRDDWVTDIIAITIIATQKRRVRADGGSYIE